MRPDRIVARILLVFSVANVALAAPAVVRQRHLDVAKAALEKRVPVSDNGGEVELGSPSSTTPLRPAGEQDLFSKWLAGVHPGPPEDAEPAWSPLGSSRAVAGARPGPPEDARPVSSPLGPPKANKFISESLKSKLLVSSGVVAVLAGTAGLAYGIHQWITRPYVSPCSPFSSLLRTSNRVTNILTCDLLQ